MLLLLFSAVVTILWGRNHRTRTFYKLFNLTNRSHLFVLSKYNSSYLYCYYKRSLLCAVLDYGFMLLLTFFFFFFATQYAVICLTK